MDLFWEKMIEYMNIEEISIYILFNHLRSAVLSVKVGYKICDMLIVEFWCDCVQEEKEFLVINSSPIRSLKNIQTGSYLITGPKLLNIFVANRIMSK